MRIGTKQFLAIGILVLVFSLALTMIPLDMTSSALKQATEGRLQDRAVSLENMLRELLVRTGADLEVITAHKALENYLTLRIFQATETMEEELNSLEAFLLRVTKAKPEYMTIQVAPGKTPVLQISEGQRVQRYDSFPFDEAMVVLQGGKKIFHQVLYDGRLALLSGAPIVTGDKVEGVLWVYQPIRERIEESLKTMAGKGLTAVVSGPGGRLVSHTAADDNQAKMLAGGDAPDWLVEKASVPELGWQISVALAKSKGFAVINHIKWSAILVTVVGLLLFVVTLRLLVSRLITRPIAGVAREMHKIAGGGGDLTVQLKVKGHDEIAELAEAFNDFVATIREAVAQVARATPEVADASRQLAELTAQARTSISSQTVDIEQVATAMNQMSSTIQEVALITSNAAQHTRQVTESGTDGQVMVHETVNTIGQLANDVETAAEVVQRLESSSVEVGGVLDVIRGIAEQTNLLALNAAIEAARAGDQGRGFAVVADEVRTLAQRTHDATYEIQEVIERMQKGATEAVNVLATEREEAAFSVEQVGKTGTTLDTILGAISEINDMTTQIASGAEEQSAVAENINRNVSNINSVAVQVDESARDMANSANELAGLVNQLEQVVEQFRV